ncbi:MULTISPECIES: hypothetical protein [Paenibacillus]|nr:MULTISPECIES: hypothetical protein [Paenibacillus]GIP23003.1 hypothetical protein J22TS3_32780 [Paenibacillus sp. J22TS3]
MPHHEPRKINNQKNNSSIMEEPTQAKPKKQNERPPSLNGVPKL